MLFVVCPDAFIQRRDKHWFISNPRTRTHVQLSADALAALGTLGGGASKEAWLDRFEKVSGADATQEFFGQFGLHTDHTGLTAQELKPLSGEQLFNLLCRRMLITSDEASAYKDYFQPLESILDRNHLGTFHQRVGQYLTVGKRLKDERWKWWHNQKFSEDGLSVRQGPYSNVQFEYVKEHFGSAQVAGKKILDFACGNGFYSNVLAQNGATVFGIDTSAELIDLATRNCGDRARFVHMDSLQTELNWLEKNENQFDMIFMQDILLLLINPEDSKNSEGTHDLLQAFHRCLKPDGSIVMMEPNATFWLSGRYGDSRHPYAVVTEYQNPVFNVMPILPDVIKVMAAAGFGLIEYVHPPYRNVSQSNGDEGAYANEFAIWDFMRFRRLAS